MHTVCYNHGILNCYLFIITGLILHEAKVKNHPQVAACGSSEAWVIEMSDQILAGDAHMTPQSG